MILAFGQATLQCLGCLLPFLEHDLIDNLPYLTASSIAVLPNSLHQDIVNSLCFYILPFTISNLIYDNNMTIHNLKKSFVKTVNCSSSQRKRSGRLPFSIICYYDGISIFHQSSTSLSITRVSNDA